jgi:hypothetical protein
MNCRNCTNAECFSGWDECLACGVAIALVEDPDYINFARRLYKDDSQWLAKLNNEWKRQASALSQVEAA